jgi:uncharacterized protein YfbU (UPF0304 family)
MPTITVRLDTDIRDAVQARASAEGVTVSDFIRNLISEVVVPIRADEQPDELAPESLTTKERHMMALLHHILARVLPEDGPSTDGIGSRDDQLERARVLEDGFTTEYWVEFAGISPELSRRDSHRVMDILDMFRVTGHSMRTLEERGTPLDERTARTLTYQGFDFNDSLESKMADYVRFLVEDGRWTEQEDFINGPSRGNSHSRNLETYLRMLAEYRSIAARQAGRDTLAADDLIAIAAEAIHPTNRHRSTPTT